MGLFTNIKDNLVTSKFKKSSTHSISELVNLTDSQLELISSKIIIQEFQNIFDNIFIKLHLKKLVQLYQYSINEFNDTINFIETFLDYEPNNIEHISNILATSDIKDIKQNLYQDKIDNLYNTTKSKLTITGFSKEYINKLLEQLPEDFKNKFYNSELTAKDIFDNLELINQNKFLRHLEASSYLSDEHKDLIEILQKFEFDTIIFFKEEIQNFYNNTNKRTELLEFIKNTNSQITLNTLDNFFYPSNDFFEKYRLLHDKNTGNCELIGKIIMKKTFINFCHKNLKNIDSKFFEILNSSLREFYNAKYSKEENIIFTEDDLNAAFCYFLQFNKNSNCVDHFTDNFISKNQELFLPTNAPQVLKDKFYNKTLTYEDFINNKEYFTNTNISLGFPSERNYYGIFSNDVFVKLLELTNGNINKLIKIKYFNNVTKNNYINSYEKFINDIILYYQNNKLNKEDLDVLIEFNLIDKNIIKNFEKMNVNLASLSDIDFRIFNDTIVNDFGFEVIKCILKYHKTSAQELFLNYYTNDKENFNKLKEWFLFLSKNGILNEKNLINSIIGFSNLSNLANNLIDINQELTKEQKHNLELIITNKNENKVTNIEQLTNYKEHKIKYLNAEFNSQNINDVKTSILKILFDITYSECLNIFTNYKLNNINFILSNFSNIISPEMLTIIEIMKEIINDKDIDSLRNRFNEIIKLGNLLSKQQFIRELDNMYCQLWKNQLFKYNEAMKDIKVSTIKGVDSDVCHQNVNGEPISSNDDIKVVTLEGEPFKLIVHSFAPNKTPDQAFKSIASNLVKNPALWNQYEGATTISTSMISDKHIKIFQNVDPPDKELVVYGFSEFPPDTYKNTCGRDNATAHGGGILNIKEGTRETPNSLLTQSYGYNEIVLKRKSDLINNQFDGRIQPTCIVCFDGEINDASKLAAQYFNVPIYMIDRHKYNHQNLLQHKKYLTENISKFNNSDIDNILISSGNINNIDYQPKDKYQLCLKLCNKALNEGIITEEEYIARLYHIKEIFIQNYPDSSDIINDLNNVILENVNGVRISNGIKK